MSEEQQLYDLTKELVEQMTGEYTEDIQSPNFQIAHTYLSKALNIRSVIKTNPIGEDYVILSKARFRDKNGYNRTACYEWINGCKIYYTHKDNIHS